MIRAEAQRRMNLHSIEVIGGIGLGTGLLILYHALFTSTTYGVLPKAWRRWMLGLQGQDEPPKASERVRL
jgi:hypothetical protein